MVGPSPRHHPHPPGVAPVGPARVKEAAALRQDAVHLRSPSSVFKDVSLSVRGKPISGTKDQAVGLVWRYNDQDNYYVARSNVLEQNKTFTEAGRVGLWIKADSVTHFDDFTVEELN